MLERYKPQNSLRDKTKRKQIDFLKRRTDYSSLYDSIAKGAELKRNQKIADAAVQHNEKIRPESATEVVQDQFAPDLTTGLPVAGKEFGPAVEKKDPGFWSKLGKGILEKIEQSEAIGKYIGSEFLTGNSKTQPVDALTKALEDAPFFKQINQRKQDLAPKYANADITAKDMLLDLIPFLPDSKVQALGGDSEAFEKFYEIQKETPSYDIPGSGLVTEQLLKGSPGIVNPALKGITGVPLKEKFPDYTPENITSIVFAPENVIDIGALKLITAPIKAASKYGAKSVTKTTLARVNSTDRGFTDINRIINPDEMDEVISYSQVRPNISEDLLPNQVFDADFDIYAQMGMAVPRSATGISRSTLHDITIKLEENVINANNYKQARKGLDKVLPGHNATDFIVPFTNKTLNLNQQEELLRQLNAFWKNETLTKKGIDALQSFDFEKLASKLKPKEKHLQDRLEINDIFKDKTEGPFNRLGQRIGDVLIGRRAAFNIPSIGRRMMQPFKIAKIFTGYRAQRPYFDEMQDIVSGKMEGNINYYLEGLNHYYDAKQRIMPQIIERDINKLRNTGSPILVNENGVTKVRDIFITEESLKKIGIVARTDSNGEVVLATTELLGNFFSKDTPYWKLTGEKSVDAARNTSLGKWVETYQNIIKESVDRNKHLGGVHLLNAEEVAENIGLYIPRIAKELDDITINPRTYKYEKSRVFTDPQAAEAVAQGYIKYHNDPLAMLRIFLTAQENANLLDEYTGLIEKVAKNKFTESPINKTNRDIQNTVKISNDIVNDLEPATGKILETKETSRIKKYFPELIKDMDDLAGMTGARYSTKLKNIQEKTQKLIKDPTSQYSTNLRNKKNYLENYKKDFDEFGINIRNRELIIKTSKRNINKIKIRMGAKGDEFTGIFNFLSKAASGTEKVSGMYQFVGAGFDIGSPFIHGIVPLLVNPKGWARGVEVMFENLFDPEMKTWTKYMANNIETLELANKLNIPIGAQTSDWLQVFQNGKMYKGTENKGWLTRQMQRIPKIGPAVAQKTQQVVPALERGFAVPIDIMKLEMLKAFRPLAKTSNELDELASVIRHSTGAMDLTAMGIGPTQRSVEALLYFSPRLLRGVSALTVDAAKGGIAGQVARTGISRLIMTTGLMAHLVSRFTGGETVYDPTNSRYGMVKIDGTWIGPNRSVQSAVQMILATAEDAATGKFFQFDYWKKGYVEDETGKKYYNDILKWNQNKSAYARQIAMQILTGEDYWGQEKNLFALEGLDVLVPMPMWMQSAQLEDATRGVRDPDAISKLIPGDWDFYWGQLLEPIGARTFKQGLWESREIARDNITRQLFGERKTWMDLTSVQQAAIENPPIDFLKGLNELDRETYEKNAALLEQYSNAYEKTFSNVKDADTINQWFRAVSAEKDLLREDIDDVTSQYETGAFGTFADFRRSVTEKEHNYYARLDQLERKYSKEYPDLDIGETLRNRSKQYPEDSNEYLYRLYLGEVANNPDFDLPSGEYDYEAHQRADKNFYDEFGSTIYKSVKSMQYLKKDQNIYTSEIITGKDIYGGKYWGAVSQQMKEYDPEIYNFYINTYQKSAPFEQEAIKKTNSRLKEFMDIQNKVKRILREQDPLLDLWIYRNGYGRETLYAKPFLDNNKKPLVQVLEKWKSLDEEINWTDLESRKKEIFPEYY